MCSTFTCARRAACRRLLVATLAFVSTSSLALAGQITGFTWSSGVASVALDPVAPPVDINNDDVAGPSPNEILVTQKHYVGIGPVDIEFLVTDSGGVTEYAISEGVHNGTGMDWTDYHVQLGFGMGDDFTPSPAGDGLDFDDGLGATSPFSMAPFTSITVGEDNIDAIGGVVPDATFVFPFVFHIDVPDGIERFTMRQYPTTDPIPEPTGAVLAIGGLLAAAMRRRTVFGRSRPV